MDMAGDNDYVDGKDTHISSVPSGQSIPSKSSTSQSSPWRSLPRKKEEPREKEFLCTHCKKVFSHKGNLRQHIRSHTKERPFSCNICGMAYTKSSHLLQHRRSHKGIHSKNEKLNQKQYNCSICDRTLFSSNSLNVHMRSHSEECTISCDQCDKMFRHKSSLNRHLKVHKGKKPYACDFCEKRFYDSSDMKKHIKVHMKSTKMTTNQVSQRKHLNTGSSLKTSAYKDNDMNGSSDQLKQSDSIENVEDTGNVDSDSDDLITDDCNIENERHILDLIGDLDKILQKESKSQLKAELENSMEIVHEGNVSNLNKILITDGFAENLPDDQPSVGIENDEIASYDRQIMLIQREKERGDLHTYKKDNIFDENFETNTDASLDLKEKLSFHHNSKDILDTCDQPDKIINEYVDERKHGEADDIQEIKDIGNEVQENISSRKTKVQDKVNVFVSNGNKINVEHNAYTKEQVLVKTIDICKDTGENVDSAQKDQEISKNVNELYCKSDVTSFETNKNLKTLCSRNYLESADNFGNQLVDIESSAIGIDYECQLESKVVLADMSKLSKDNGETVKHDLTVKNSKDSCATEGNSISHVSQQYKHISPNGLANLTETNKDSTVAKLNKNVFKACQKIKNNEECFISKFIVMEPRILRKKKVSTYQEALRKEIIYLGTRLNVSPIKHTVSESGIEPKNKMVRTEFLTTQSDSEIQNAAQYISEQGSDSKFNLNNVSDTIVIDDEDEDLSLLAKPLQLEIKSLEETPILHSDKPQGSDSKLNVNDVSDTIVIDDKDENLSLLTRPLQSEITPLEETPFLHSDKPLTLPENSKILRKSDMMHVEPFINSYEKSITGNTTETNSMTKNKAYISSMNGYTTETNHMTENITNIKSTTEFTNNTNNITGNMTDINKKTVKIRKTDKLTGNSRNTKSITGDMMTTNGITGNMTDINSMAGNMTDKNNMIGNSTNTNGITENKKYTNNIIGKNTSETNCMTEYTTYKNNMDTNNITETMTDINIMTGNSRNNYNMTGNERDTNSMTENTTNTANNLEACKHDTPIHSNHQNNDSTVKMQTQNLKEYFCRHCKRRFDVHRKFIRHLKQHFRSKEFTCEECDQCFSKWRDFSHHKCRDKKRKYDYTCIHCDKVFGNEKLLNCHMEKKKFSCTLCNKVTCSTKLFNKHKMIHFEIKCLSCSKRFETKFGLNTHLNACHSVKSGKNVQVDLLHEGTNLNEINKIDELTGKSLDVIKKGAIVKSDTANSVDIMKVDEDDLERTIYQNVTVAASSISKKQAELDRDNTNIRTDDLCDIDISHKEDRVLSFTKKVLQSEMGKLLDTAKQSSSLTAEGQVSVNHMENIADKKEEITNVAKKHAEEFKDTGSIKDRNVSYQFNADTIETAAIEISEPNKGSQYDCLKNRIVAENNHISYIDRNSTNFSKSVKRKLKGNQSKFVVSDALFCKKNKMSKHGHQKEKLSSIANKVFVTNDKNNEMMKENENVKNTSLGYHTLFQERASKMDGKRDSDKVGKAQMKSKPLDIHGQDSKIKECMASINVNTDMVIGSKIENKYLDNSDDNACNEVVWGNFNGRYTSVNSDNIEMDSMVFDNNNDGHTSTCGDDIEEDDVVSDNDSDGYEECTTEEVQAMLSVHKKH